MSDDNGQQQNPEPAAQPTGGDGTDWKAEARKWEQRAKQNRADNDRISELESKFAESSKSLEEALGKLSGYEEKEQRSKLVSDVAESTGLSADVVGTLGGTTAEELTAQAEKIKPLIGANRVVIPNVGDAPENKATPETEFVGALFSQAD